MWEKNFFFLFYCFLMKIHSVIPRKMAKRSYDCMEDELVSFLTLTPTLYTGQQIGQSPFAFFVLPQLG